MKRPSGAARAVAGYGLDLGPARYPSAPIDDRRWQRLERDARRHRLTGLLFAACRSGAFPVTSDQADRVDELHRADRAISLRGEAQLLDVARRFRESGVASRVLKGPASAHLHYPDPQLRPFRDIDLLIEPDQIDAAHRVLRDLGGRRRYPEPRPGYDRAFGKGLCVVLPDGSEIDLHRTLALGWYGLRVDTDDLFAGTRSFTLRSTELDALSDDRALIHACYHATLGSAYPPLVTQRDIVQILLADESVGPVAIERARTWDSEAVLAIAIDEAWRSLQPAARPAVVGWAASYPTDDDRRRLAAYRGPSRNTAMLAVGGVGAVDGVGARFRYLAAVATPAASRAPASQRWRRGWHALRSRAAG